MLFSKLNSIFTLGFLFITIPTKPKKGMLFLVNMAIFRLRPSHVFRCLFQLSGVCEIGDFGVICRYFVVSNPRNCLDEIPFKLNLPEVFAKDGDRRVLPRMDCESSISMLLK